MDDGDRIEQDDLPAGAFSTWLDGMQGALRGDVGADVPCAGCTACCMSSQFVHIGPDETETLSRIPRPLLFPAPGMPAGHVVLGYDEHGRCPMLTDGGCSIYEHRPQTCRTYDCRIFPAAGLEPDKELIARRARRWRFDFPSEADGSEHGAVRAAAAFLQDHGDVVPERSRPTNATQLAVLAVEVHDAFLHHDAGARRVTVVNPDPAEVRVALTRKRSTRPGS